MPLFASLEYSTLYSVLRTVMNAMCQAVNIFFFFFASPPFFTFFFFSSVKGKYSSPLLISYVCSENPSSKTSTN